MQHTRSSWLLAGAFTLAPLVTHAQDPRQAGLKAYIPNAASTPLPWPKAIRLFPDPVSALDTSPRASLGSRDFTTPVQVKPGELDDVRDAIRRRNQCPMPVAHSKPVTPMPNGYFILPKDTVAMRAAAPCYNPLDTKNR